MDKYQFDSINSNRILNTWSVQFSFEELVKIFDSALKRSKNSWNKKQSCLFIESILIGIPISSFYIAIIDDRQYLLDGFHRLKTVYDFIKGTNSNDNTEFKLECSSCNYWLGKNYNTLDDYYKSKIKVTSVNGIIVKLKDEDTLSEISMRINPTKGLRKFLSSKI